jgi:hypothetical protein
MPVPDAPKPHQPTRPASEDEPDDTGGRARDTGGPAGAKPAGAAQPATMTSGVVRSPLNRVALRTSKSRGRLPVA